MTTRRLYQAGGAVLIAGAAALFYASSQMPYATSLGPGPGFFPTWLSGILLGLGVVMVVQATIEAPRTLPEDFWPAEGGVGRMLAIVGAVGLAAIGIETAGFAPAMLAACLLMLLALGDRRPLPLAAVALAASFGTYYVFTRWLGVQLPGGWLAS